MKTAIERIGNIVSMRILNRVPKHEKKFIDGMKRTAQKR
jgi:hypothetical protein